MSVSDLATGEELLVPENASTLRCGGDRLAFGIYAPGDAVPDEENDDLTSIPPCRYRSGTALWSTGTTMPPSFR